MNKKESLDERLDIHLKAISHDTRQDSSALETRILASVSTVSQETVSHTTISQATGKSSPTFRSDWWKNVMKFGAPASSYAAIGFCLMLSFGAVSLVNWLRSGPDNISSEYQSSDLEWEEMWLLEDEILFAQIDPT